MKSSCNTLSTVALLAVLALGLVGYGAKLLPVHLMLLGGMMILGIVLPLVTRLPLPRHTALMLAPGLAALAWHTATLLPVTEGSPLASFLHPLWHSAGKLLGTTHPTVSMDAAAGVLPLITALATGVAFVAGATLALQGRAKLLLRGLTVLITALSLYGLGVYAAGNDWVLASAKTAYTDSLTATFINRNTFATVAGLGVLLGLHALAATLPNLPSAGKASFRQRLRLFLHLSLFPTWPWLVMAGVNFIALVLTLSRGGLAATLIALIVWWFIILAKARGGRPFWLAFGGALLATSLVFLPLAAHTFTQRLLTASESAGTREGLNLTSLAAHQANPWVGYGLGTYNGVYRMFDFSDPAKPNPLRMVHAHNSWLESLVESGRPAAILWFTALAGIAIGLLRQLKVRRTGYTAPALAVGAGLLVALHGWVDFSPHNPAVAILIAIILGTGWGQGSITPKAEPTPTALPLRLGTSAIAALALVVLAWQTPARLATYNLENALAPSNAGRLYGDIQANAKQHPSAASHRLAAYAGILTASSQPQLYNILLTQSLAQTSAALAYAPLDPFLWHQRAQLQTALKQPQAAAQSLTYSYLTGPSESALAKPRYALTKKLWPLLSDDNKAVLTPNLARLTEARPKQFPPLQ